MLHLSTENDLDLFRVALARWFRSNARDLPWRRTRDPYSIWISEAMLQQTRVDQAIGFYLRFLERYPTVQELADAELQEVLKTWEGLGYYARARNLHRAARTIVDLHEGQIPDDEARLRELPGVGPYTAAAILSIAFGQDRAAVDGNVIRVLSRYFLVEQEVDRLPVRRLLEDLAAELLDREEPGRFNQAVMELGATVCTPRSPSCDRCVLAPGCLALRHDMVGALPRKRPKKRVPHFEVGVALLFDREDRILVRRRPNDGMLGGLWEFPGGRARDGETAAAACQRGILEKTGIEVTIGTRLHSIRHGYSHFKITLIAFEAKLPPGWDYKVSEPDLESVPVGEIESLPFSRASRKMLDFLIERGVLGERASEGETPR